MLNFQKVLILIIIGSFIFSCKDDDNTNALIPIVDKALNDTSSIYYSDFGHYPQNKKNLPIGVFDSGIKGMMMLESFLTVDKYDNITGRKGSDGIPDFAGEKFIYLADIANFPYSAYNTNNNTDYLRELMMKNALFLMGEDYYNISADNIQTGVKEPVKIVVSSSCNQASTHGVSDIKDFLSKTMTGVNLVGIIESSVEDALDGLEPTTSYAIGLIAAPNAEVVNEYERELREEYAKLKLTGVVQFFSQVGDDFSISTSIKDSSYTGPLIGKNDGDIDITLMDRYKFDMSEEAISYKQENGAYTDIRLKSPANYARFHLVSLVEKHRRTGSNIPIKSVIIGNMLHPYLLDTLTSVVSELRSYKRDGLYLYEETIAEELRLIDPIESTIQKAYEVLRSSGNLAFNPQKSELRAFVSVPTYGLSLDLLNADGSLSDKYKYSRDAGSDEVSTKILPFSSRYVGDSELKGIESLMPHSYSLIKNTLY